MSIWLFYVENFSVYINILLVNSNMCNILNAMNSDNMLVVRPIHLLLTLIPYVPLPVDFFLALVTISVSKHRQSLFISLFVIFIIIIIITVVVVHTL